MNLVFTASYLSGLALVTLAGCQQSTVEDDQANARRNTVFRSVPANESGITFQNRITETFQDNIVINSYLYNGGGVAVIDIDNDGLKDVLFVGSQQENKLYLNKGNLEFEDITDKAGVALPGGVKTGVAVHDINNDGYDDIYVCRSGMAPNAERDNALFINNGDLTFTESAAKYGLALRSASNHANFFDYDLDGDLDVYVVNHPVNFKDVNRIILDQSSGTAVRRQGANDEWESDRLLRNDGNGSFTDISAEAGIDNRAWGLSCTVSDFNKDGFPDILVGNDYIEPDYLYINQGNGTFADETYNYFRHTAANTMGVDIADINNDAFPDVVAMDMIAPDNERQKALMTIMMNDRYNTLVSYGYGHQIMRNTLNLNTGATTHSDGRTFSEIGTLAGISNTDWSWGVLLADFDNDGLKDMYVTNGVRRDVTDLDYLTYTVDSVMRAGGLNKGKFNSIQEYLDLIPSKALPNYMFQNHNGLTFENVSKSWGLNQPSFSNGAAYADFDNDGDLDIAVNQIDQTASLYENRSNEFNNNWVQFELKGEVGNRHAIGSKVMIELPGGQIQYAEVTPTRGWFSSNDHIVHFGLSSDSTISRVQIEWPDGKHIHTLESVNPGQRYVLEESYAAKGSMSFDMMKRSDLPKFELAHALSFTHIENTFIDFDKQMMVPHMFSTQGPHSAVDDINGDGLDDVYICGARGQAGVLYLQDGKGAFTQKPLSTFEEDANYEDTDAVFLDADNDGDQDLFVVSGGSSERNESPLYVDRLYLNNGNGQFTRAATQAIPSSRTSGSTALAFDYDQDGDSDIVIGGLVTPGKYPIIPKSRLLQNNGGKFTDVTADQFADLTDIGHVKDFKWADLNNDGQNELIVTGEWMSIEVYRYENNSFLSVTKQFGLAESNGWWNCIEVADLDSDGDLDLIGGNLGLNTRLKASKTEPLKLYSADFDNNSQVDAIMAYYEDGKEYPLATREMMIKQLPYIKKKFVKNRKYSMSTIRDVFDDGELRNADVFEAYDLANVWFENRDGAFIRHELNLEAQVAPCFAILTEDLNNDGHIDLLLGGNDYGSDIESGRYDAGSGILLLNDGSGNFSYAPNWETGLWATGQVREITSIETPAGPTTLVLRNDAEVITYRRKND